jgi:putative aldouronate transport system substrate-binding protein
MSASQYNYWQHSPFGTNRPDKNLQAHLALKDAFATKDASKLDSEQQMYHNFLSKYLNNDKADTLAYGYYWVFGPQPESSFAVIDGYVKNKQIMLNAFYGAPTETMAARESSLKTLRDEVFTKIIMGSSPISAFDTFVQDWKRQGGDAITKEVNDWAKTH